METTATTSPAHVEEQELLNMLDVPEEDLHPAPAFTAGPWKSQVQGQQALIMQENGPENVAVCYEAKNADLIAAAPELLAALKFSVDCPDEDEALRVVQAAIAKAEGTAA